MRSPLIVQKGCLTFCNKLSLESFQHPDPFFLIFMMNFFEMIISLTFWRFSLMRKIFSTSKIYSKKYYTDLLLKSWIVSWLNSWNLNEKFLSPIVHNLLNLTFMADFSTINLKRRFLKTDKKFNEVSLRGSVHFYRYGYELLMKNFLLGLYILLNIPPK